MIWALTSQFLDLSTIFLILAVFLCLVPSILLKRKWERFVKAEKQVFATAYNTEAAYDAIVKEIDEWCSHALKKHSINPLKWGRPIFAVYKNVRPKLYRVIDRDTHYRV